MVFFGNASVDDMCYEIETILKGESIKSTNRFNVHFARMGEPTFNLNVLIFAEHRLRNLEQFILEWCNIKNFIYNGEAGLQFSINSTDDKQRCDQFNGKSLTLQQISD